MSHIFFRLRMPTSTVAVSSILFFCAPVLTCQDAGEIASVRMARELGARIETNTEGKAVSISFVEKKTGMLNDEDLAKIDFSAFSKLSRVYLVAQNITDSSLAQIAKSRKLTNLTIACAHKISDKGIVKILASQRDLDFLELAFLPISDAAVDEIDKTKGLMWLEIRNTHISDKSIQRIAKLSMLYWLNLENSKVTDMALFEICKLDKLMTLNLNGTKVTDEGMKHLYEMKNLRILNLSWTKVSNKAKEKLREELPNLKIIE